MKPAQKKQNISLNSRKQSARPTATAGQATYVGLVPNIVTMYNIGVLGYPAPFIDIWGPIKRPNVNSDSLD